MVSSARNAPSSHHRELRRQQRRRNLGAPAHFRAEHPQPPRGQQAGVQREEIVAGGVHESLGGPYLPADAAAHRVIALAKPQRQHSHPEHRQQRIDQHRGQRRHRGPQRGGCDRRGHRVGVADAPPDHGQPDAEGHQRHPAQEHRRHPVDRHPQRRPCAAGGPATDGGPCPTSPRASPSSTGRS